MKRLGLAALLVAALVFGVEGILALLRQRTIEISIQVTNSQDLGIATPQATAAAGPATPAAKDSSTTLALAPDADVLVRVRWDYKIGPRFPDTVIQAQVLDQAGKVVASDRYTIDCGNAPLECNGTTTLSLHYGVKNKEGAGTAWPAGDYTVQVTRAFADLNSTQIAARSLRVMAPQ